MTYSTQTRAAVVRLHWARGLSAASIARRSFPKMSLSTVQRILSEFKRTGRLTTPTGGRRVRPGKIPLEIVAWLTHHLDTVDATLFLDEMSDLVAARFGRRYSVSLLCATLLRRRYTRKKLTIIQARRDEFERGWFREVVMPSYLAEQIVCLDETRKDPATLRRTHGRASRNARAYARYAFTRRASGWSATGIMSIDGMIGCFMSQSPGVRTEEFLAGVYEHLLPLLQPYPQPRSVVLLDNAAIHWAPEFVELVEACGARVLYLPAYSYDLMPIERAFSKAKAYLERLHGSNRAYVEGWPEQALRDALFAVTAEDAVAYFRDCGWVVTELLPGLFQ